MNKKELHNIKKSGYKVPKDYFSKVEEHILNEVNLISKTEDSGLKVPNSYFDNIDQKILNRISQEEDTKVVRLFSWKKTMYVAAVAACLILMFNVFMNPSETLNFESIEMASIEDYIEEEELSTYELASLLTEEELNTNNFIDNNIPESSIEDYLLDNVDLEDLIIEQ